MASEKITAMIEEVKTLTVLELAELVHALEETNSAFPPLPLLSPLPLPVLLPLRKRRLSSTSF